MNTDSYEIIEDISLGTNEIINKIGKDRSHISKSIKFLKDRQLLGEHDKWQEGKRKDTRLTELGVVMGRIVYRSKEYNKAISVIAKELRETLSLRPESFSLSERSKTRIIKSNFTEYYFPSDSRWSTGFNTYRNALSSIESLAERLPSDIVGKYWNIISEFKLDNKKRHFIDLVIMNTIYTYMQDISKEIKIFTSWIEGQKDLLDLNGKEILLETSGDCIYYRISIMRE